MNPFLGGELVLMRHAESTYNQLRLVNGDPRVPVPLSQAGEQRCRELAPLAAEAGFASLYCTRFMRTHQTALLLMPDGPEPVPVPELDDIDLGDFEGRTIEEWRAWRHVHDVAEAPPGGESRLECVRRYAAGLASIAAEAPAPALVVTHDQPIRYLLNAIAGADLLDGPTRSIPNAEPYALARSRVAHAADRMAAWAAEQEGRT